MNNSQPKMNFNNAIELNQPKINEIPSNFHCLYNVKAVSSSEEL